MHSPFALEISPRNESKALRAVNTGYGAIHSLSNSSKTSVPHISRAAGNLLSMVKIMQPTTHKAVLTIVRFPNANEEPNLVSNQSKSLWTGVRRPNTKLT